MKTTIYVVTTCIPDRGAEPCQPWVFATEQAAEDYMDTAMRAEWDAAEEWDDDGLRPYPGDWREAQEMLVARYDDGSWGTWQITSHHIEIGEAQP